MKKLLLTLGTVAAVAAPVASVIACGTTDPFAARKKVLIADISDKTKYIIDDVTLRKYIGEIEMFDSEHQFTVMAKNTEQFKIENVHRHKSTVDAQLDSIKASDVVKNLSYDGNVLNKGVASPLISKRMDLFPKYMSEYKPFEAECVGRAELTSDSGIVKDVYYFNGIDINLKSTLEQFPFILAGYSRMYYSYFAEGSDPDVVPGAGILDKYKVKATVPTSSTVKDLSFMKTSDFSLTITKGDFDSPLEVIWSTHVPSTTAGLGTGVETIKRSNAWRVSIAKWS